MKAFISFLLLSSAVIANAGQYNCRVSGARDAVAILNLDNLTWLQTWNTADSDLEFKASDETSVTYLLLSFDIDMKTQTYFQLTLPKGFSESEANHGLGKIEFIKNGAVQSYRDLNCRLMPTAPQLAK